jgi:hypothetical protein
MTAKVLQFPIVRIPCASCGTLCIEEKLEDPCDNCGERYCAKSSNGCPAQCACDRLAIDMVQRAAIFLDGWPTA